MYCGGGGIDAGGHSTWSASLEGADDSGIGLGLILSPNAHLEHCTASVSCLSGTASLGGSAEVSPFASVLTISPLVSDSIDIPFGFEDCADALLSVGHHFGLTVMPHLTHSLSGPCGW